MSGNILFLNGRNLDFVRPYNVLVGFGDSGDQESIKDCKETAPDKNNMQTKTPNFYIYQKNLKMGGTKLGPNSLEISLFSDLDAFWLHFGPQVVSRPMRK